MTTSVRRARGSSLHVDVKLSIPCLPTLDSADADTPQQHQREDSKENEDEKENASNSAAVSAAQPAKANAGTASMASGGSGSGSAGRVPTAAGAESAPSVAISHAVMSRPRPLIRKRPQPTNPEVLSEISLNAQQHQQQHQQHQRVNQPAHGAVAASDTSAVSVSSAAPPDVASLHSPVASSVPAGAEDERSAVSSNVPAVKPRRSQLMSAMMEQRDRKRREDTRRKEEEMARLQHMAAAVQQSTYSTLSAGSGSTAASRFASLQRTMEHADVSTALREDKRKREADGQKLRERRMGLRDRMKEMGVVGCKPSEPSSRTPTRRSRGKGQSPHAENRHTGSSGHAAVPDAQRQSILPCTFHLAHDDEDENEHTDGMAQQPLSLDDIMAGRVNYQ